jgi:hypothetical protein
MEGNQLGIGKRQYTLAENREKQWEKPMLTLPSVWMDVRYCGWMQGRSENCHSVTSPGLLFHTGESGSVGIFSQCYTED